MVDQADQSLDHRTKRMASKFTKSQSNRGTERYGLSVLLSDPRFQEPNLATKKHILELIGASALFGHQTFDAVMTPEARPPLALHNIDGFFDELTLVEMKTTRKPIQDAALNGFFFGATERERAMGEVLGERYLFAFVVLNTNNDFGRPFAVLLPLDEVQRRTRPWRTQYQVNFRNDIVLAPDETVHQVVVFGSESDVPPEETAP